MWALTHGEEQDLPRVLARLDLSTDEVLPTLNALGFHASGWHKPLGACDWRKLVESLAQEPCRSLIRQKGAAARALAERYLEQEAFFDGVACALVDSGGLGSQMRTLGRLRLARNQPPIEGFAFYRDGDPQLPLEGFPELHVYLRDNTHRVGHARLKGMWEMLELFCTADHGTVSSYRENDGRVEPVVEASRTERVQAWGLRLVQETLCAFAEHVACEDFVAQRTLQGDAREALGAALSTFWNAPLANEAEAWGRFPWELEAGAEEAELASPLGAGEALALLKGNPAHERIWPAGAERRSPFVIRTALRLGRGVPRPLRRLVRSGWRTLTGGGAPGSQS